MRLSELIYTDKKAIKYISENWKIRNRYIDYDNKGKEQWGYIMLVNDYKDVYFLPDNNEYFRIVIEP